ncbi:MAG: CPBP family intramembrane metalloprotease [Acetatifactor sp.]|nr:CPBP family intramembrane metalloprotease [Acetatifactor sp.]
MVYLLPIRCVIFALTFVVGAIMTKQKTDDISNWWSIAASIVNIVTILILVYVAKKNKSSYRELINYQKGKTKAKQIIGISVLVLVVGMSGMYVAGYICYGIIPYAAPMMIAPIPVWLAIINVIILPVTTVFAEEGLYLGCGVNQIQNKLLAITVPAFFFALQHSFIPTLFDFRYIIYRFISFLPLTLILCWYYYRKRNPLPIMVGHAIIDVATVLQILATSTISGLYEMMCEM